VIRTTIDTNLLASGIVGFEVTGSPPGELLRVWQQGVVTLVLSQFIHDELANTLASPYFRRRLPEEQRRRFLELLGTDAEMTPLTVTVEGVATHPEDDLVLATAVSGGAQFLVTGDHRLLALREYEGVVIVSVREFLALLPGLLSERPEGTR
jgi:putative PIN family toxin of toxin-antitoxin system